MKPRAHKLQIAFDELEEFKIIMMIESFVVGTRYAASAVGTRLAVGGIQVSSFHFDPTSISTKTLVARSATDSVIPLSAQYYLSV